MFREEGTSTKPRGPSLAVGSRPGLIDTVQVSPALHQLPLLSGTSINLASLSILKIKIKKSLGLLWWSSGLDSSLPI